MISLKSRKNEFNNLIWGIALTVFTLFVFAPVILYLGNQADLHFQIRDFLPYVILFGVCLALFLLFVGWILPRKGLAVFAAFVFAAGLALYLQGNYLNTTYGDLDGRGIDWSGFGSYPYVNTVIWILLIAVSIVLALKQEKLFGKIVRYTSLFILLIEAISLGVYLVSIPRQGNDEHFSVSTKMSSNLSRNSNTIVLVVDACDTQYFERMLAEKQEIVDTFDGFTYFPDYVGSYSKTKMSVPFLLTGKWYENRETVQDFLRDAYKDVPLYSKLKENNYTIGLYTDYRYLSDDVIDLADNVVKAQTKVGDHWGVSKQLLDFCCFSYFPHILKPYFEFYTYVFDKYNAISTGEPLYSIDNYLFQDFCKADFFLTDENAFRFYHITGSHLPCDMDENGQWVGPWKSDAYRQTLGVFRSVKTFFDSLKALDIYDRSTIIVTADHGRFDEGLSFPLLLVKRPDERGEVKVNNASVSQSEFHATILKCAGIETDGDSFFDIDENEDRERRFLYYPTTYQNDGYLPPLTEYMIGRGLTSSATGLVYTKDGVTDQTEAR